MRDDIKKLELYQEEQKMKELERIKKEERLRNYYLSKLKKQMEKG